MQTDDDNRVILSKTEDHESEYINASYVDVSAKHYILLKMIHTSSAMIYILTFSIIVQGYSVPKKFIASQGK